MTDGNSGVYHVKYNEKNADRLGEESGRAVFFIFKDILLTGIPLYEKKNSSGNEADIDKQ